MKVVNRGSLIFSLSFVSDAFIRSLPSSHHIGELMKVSMNRVNFKLYTSSEKREINRTTLQRKQWQQRQVFLIYFNFSADQSIIGFL